ncbi:MAG: helix-turn-helix domain-containing protein, partial [Natronomonas sp.]|nr:helix-turn-helix domain-containing protein [Natronomonas sp.]
MSDTRPRDVVARQIASDILLSETPGSTLKKWRSEFDVSQVELAEKLDISASVISDQETGRRRSPDLSFIRRAIDDLLDIEQSHGGTQLRQYARVLSAGFDTEVILDRIEYPTRLPLAEFYRTIDATEIETGEAEKIAGHTVVDSIEAITQLTTEGFYRLYRRGKNRALVFTNITRGEGSLVDAIGPVETTLIIAE